MYIINSSLKSISSFYLETCAYISKFDIITSLIIMYCLFEINIMKCSIKYVTTNAKKTYLHSEKYYQWYE